jgi:hypothetical protein
MGIKFLGTPIRQFDRLCSEEEKVIIEIKCFKTEHVIDKDGRFVTEDIQTGGWGVQIKSWKDIFQVDDEDDYPDKKDIRDELREKLK